MIHRIINKIAENITALPISGNVAGIVKTIKKEVRIDKETSIKSFPVSCDTNFEECFNKGDYKNLVPDSRLRSLAYFELNNTRVIGQDSFSFKYESNLRFVFWYNQKMISNFSCDEISTYLTQVLPPILSFNKLEVEGANNIKSVIGGVVYNEYSIFSKYSYKEILTPYLMKPYGAISIDLKIIYDVSKICLPTIEIIENPC